jgi:hypothetical protein
VSEDITAFVGLDVHKESTAIAVAEGGWEAPRFVGTVGPELAALRKALGKIGTAETLQGVTRPAPVPMGSRVSCRRKVIVAKSSCRPRSPVGRASGSRPIGAMR